MVEASKDDGGGRKLKIWLIYALEPTVLEAPWSIAREQPKLDSQW